MNDGINVPEIRVYARYPGRITDDELIGRHLGCEDLYNTLGIKGVSKNNPFTQWEPTIQELKNLQKQVSAQRFYTHDMDYVEHSGPLTRLLALATDKALEGYCIKIDSWW